MSRLTNVCATATIVFLAWFTANAVNAADLEVQIPNLRSSEGSVRVALHPRGATVKFPNEAGAIAGAFRQAAVGSTRFVFTDLPPGDYAVAAFHDRNGDGKLTKNILGIPTEPYGFSNNVYGFMGPAGFEKAAVTVSADSDRLSITVRIN